MAGTTTGLDPDIFRPDLLRFVIILTNNFAKESKRDLTAILKVNVFTGIKIIV